MATIDLPTDSAVERGEPPGLVSPELGEVIKYGEGLGDEQYLEELGKLIGHDILITTFSAEHLSPLAHASKFRVMYRPRMQFNRCPTVLQEVNSTELFFPYEHVFPQHYKEDTVREIVAIAPIDRDVTTIYLPA